TGLSPLLTSAFTTLTLLISIPSGIFFLNWLGTIWRGSIRFHTPMLFALGTVFTFGLGGLTGLHLGAASTNMLLHNTYFVVGHFHFTMAVAALLGGFAATYYWFPKMFGRLLDERMGKVHFWFSIVPIVFIFTGQMVAGYAGMHRRIYNPYEYNYLQDLLPLNQYIGIAVAIVFFAQFLFLGNIIYSMKKGKVAGDNPWEVGTLEWTISSPPPHYNFAEIPVVKHGPHEFSHPGRSDRDWTSQIEPEGVLSKG
ncbi:MAG TPA: cbb3-type cytochrome c oxidase subunit I, partial [Bdellovibrionota bacterium]|nr:cbb3-type cytochrome c oxidase subunit I [Bdellovibrionota bacterium]